MPEVIDSLLLEIGLDPKDFKKGMEDALKSFAHTKDGATKAAKEMEERGKQASSFFSSLKTEALGLLAVFTAGVGLKQFTEHTIQTGTNLNNLSKNLNMSSQSIQAWQQAGKQMGGSGEEVLGTLERVTQASAKYKMGLGGAPDKFMMAGGNVDELKKGPEQYLFEAGRVLKKLAKEQGRDVAYSLASEMMIDNTTFNALVDNKQGIGSRISENKKLFSLDRSDIDNLSELNKEIVNFKASAESTGQILISALAPQIRQVLADFNELSKWFVEHKDDVSRWAQNTIDLTKEAAKSLFYGIYNAEEAGPKDENKLIDQSMKSGDWKNAFSSGDNKGKEDKETLFANLERKYGLEPGLLNAIHQEESGGGKNMLSPKGAMGHFQFMPETAKQYGLKDPNNLEESADAAGRFLADLKKQNGGDRNKMLAAYNWGQGNVDRKGLSNAPSETVKYMSDINRMMSQQTNNNTTTITTGPVTINTKSTDAKGIKREFDEEAKNKFFVNQAETGAN